MLFACHTRWWARTPCDIIIVGRHSEWKIRQYATRRYESVNASVRSFKWVSTRSEPDNHWQEGANLLSIIRNIDTQNIRKQSFSCTRIVRLCFKRSYVGTQTRAHTKQPRELILMFCVFCAFGEVNICAIMFSLIAHGIVGRMFLGWTFRICCAVLNWSRNEQTASVSSTHIHIYKLCWTVRKEIIIRECVYSLDLSIYEVQPCFNNIDKISQNVDSALLQLRKLNNFFDNTSNTLGLLCKYIVHPNVKKRPKKIVYIGAWLSSYKLQGDKRTHKLQSSIAINI